MKKYWATFNRFEFEMPADAVEDCHHSGACDDDVEHWLSLIDIKANREDMVAELSEYGFDDDVSTWDDDRLKSYLIWIAAGNIQEENLTN